MTSKLMNNVLLPNPSERAEAHGDLETRKARKT